jgi:hypothetical protein
MEELEILVALNKKARAQKNRDTVNAMKYDNWAEKKVRNKTKNTVVNILLSMAAWVEFSSRGVAAYKAHDSLGIGLRNILLCEQQMNIGTWARGYKMAAPRDMKAIYLAN